MYTQFYLADFVRKKAERGGVMNKNSFPYA
jgi:hypothetical protein